jgi:hypothetical protein
LKKSGSQFLASDSPSPANNELRRPKCNAFGAVNSLPPKDLFQRKYQQIQRRLGSPTIAPLVMRRGEFIN